MRFDDQQRKIWLDRYALRDKEGEPVEQDITETWVRVANAIADDERQAERFYDILNDFRFVPGGRILAGAGAEAEKTFYNCYVIPVETKARRKNRSKDGYHSQEFDSGSDSREAIFDTIGTMVDIMSRGGGVGINWSVLRPARSYLKRVSGTSSGPVGWMDVASTAVGEVEQGGSRRGAAMFMIDDWHPDVLSFIQAKRSKGKIVNANISLAVSDAFMKAVEDDTTWDLVFPDTTHPDYDKVWDGDIKAWRDAGRPVRTHETVEARRVWNAIAESAHASGEPGVIFLDRYNELSTANGSERIICVNPCGEQGLGAYSVCNLGAMNLYAYCEQEPSGGRYRFRWNAFSDDVAVAIQFLDNVIDKTVYFIPETEAQQKRLRRIGLGVMGLADALVVLGVRYGSPESVDFVNKVFRTMKDSALESSMELGLEKGTAEWREETPFRPYLKEYAERTRRAVWPLRNLFLLTQAPTGTTSLLAGVNSGIEPYFNIKTWREDRTGGRYVHAAAVAAVLGDAPEGTELPPFVVTASDVTVEEHIAVQAAVQRWVDSSVSKTINAPSSQSVEETRRAFDLAYESGLKGIAYYRDGSRSVQVLYNEDPNETINRLTAKIGELSAKLAFKDRALSYSGVSLAEMPTTGTDLCPSCNTGIPVHEEGCMKCHSCGWSAC